MACGNLSYEATEQTLYVDTTGYGQLIDEDRLRPRQTKKAGNNQSK
jgi:hypothetical protein